MKINKAKAQLEEAKRQVVLFQHELKDVSVRLQFQVNIGDFLTFADFLFDGIFTDVIVQSKISDAKEQVDRAIWQVEQIINDLYRICLLYTSRCV